MLKTFWTGAGGWSDRQLPDGTIVWTSPSGIEHRAPPGSRIHFPDWDTTTPVPDTAPPQRTSPSRGLSMPTRKTTRARQYAQAIHTERERNRRAAEENPAPF